MKCPACNKPQRNIGIGPKPLWHCDHCEMADTEPMTNPGGAPPPDYPKGFVIYYGNRALKYLGNGNWAWLG